MPVPPIARRSTSVTPAPVAAVTTPCEAGRGSEQAGEQASVVRRRAGGGGRGLPGLQRAKPGSVVAQGRVGGRGSGRPCRDRVGQGPGQHPSGRGRALGASRGPARRQRRLWAWQGPNWGRAGPADAPPFEWPGRLSAMARPGPLAHLGEAGEGAWPPGRLPRLIRLPLVAAAAAGGCFLGGQPLRVAPHSTARPWASQRRPTARWRRETGCGGLERRAAVHNTSGAFRAPLERVLSLMRARMDRGCGDGAPGRRSRRAACEEG